MSIELHSNIVTVHILPHSLIMYPELLLQTFVPTIYWSVLSPVKKKNYFSKCPVTAYLLKLYDSDCMKCGIQRHIG